MRAAFAALCCLPAAFAQDINVEGIPVIDWLLSERTPLSSNSGFSAPVCFDIDSDADKDCKPRTLLKVTVLSCAAIFVSRIM